MLDRKEILLLKSPLPKPPPPEPQRHVHQPDQHRHLYKRPYDRGEGLPAVYTENRQSRSLLENQREKIS